VEKNSVVKNRQRDGNDSGDEQQKSIAPSPIILARLSYTQGKFLELPMLAAVPRLEFFN
jgi:hypothetical protein